jgi:hypothetical protein
MYQMPANFDHGTKKQEVTPGNRNAAYGHHKAHDSK